ncbi:MAG: hypothetical protein KDI03_12055 [Anaerolineae bacterium]|nr:hypothetical protein [Anaerolineae bacterium]
MTLLHGLVFLLGLAIVVRTLVSALRTFVLARGARDRLTGWLFGVLRVLFNLLLRTAKSYERRDQIMAFYAPVALLLLLPYWLILTAIGFGMMYWATSVDTLWATSFTLSGSSLLTLGFARDSLLIHDLLAFAEATIGLILVALLIAYLPTMYAAFSRRELQVTLLEVRAGSPPSAVELIARFHRLHRLETLHDLWETWESWFAEVEESHTSLAALVFWRSPQPDHSWITASGAVLDAASLMRSVVDVPDDMQADLTIRAGFLALRRIADFFNIDYVRTPSFPANPISIARAEFDTACAQLEDQGVPLRPDRDQAWQDFGGWRVNYDTVLLALCHLTVAPYAPWSSDRSLLPDAGRKGKKGKQGKPRP